MMELLVTASKFDCCFEWTENVTEVLLNHDRFESFINKCNKCGIKSPLTLFSERLFMLNHVKTVQMKVMVGGAPVTQKYADEIGADGYGRDAAAAAQGGHPAGAFTRLFEEVRAFFGDFTAEALIQSSFLIDRIVERS